jgi:hypothetical protein
MRSLIFAILYSSYAIFINRKFGRKGNIQF